MNNTNDESHRCEMDKKDAASASITPPRRRARQRDKAPRLDGKATDTLLRVFLALYGKPDTEPSPRADHPQSTPEPEQKVATPAPQPLPHRGHGSLEKPRGGFDAVPAGIIH